MNNTSNVKVVPLSKATLKVVSGGYAGAVPI